MLSGKIALITGASQGIGEATAYKLAEAGCNLILIARNYEKLAEIEKNILSKHNVKILIKKIDLRNYSEIESFINSLDEYWRKIDILINNAGLAKGMNLFYEDTQENWEEVFATNVNGLFKITHMILPLMLEKGSGHIIFLGSIAGHQPYPRGSIYCASKSAVKAFSESLRMELIDKNIRISSVDPGMVETNFSNVRFDGDTERAKNVYKGLTPLNANDIAEAILFCATRPPHCNINQMIIMPSVQASSTLVHRKS